MSSCPYNMLTALAYHSTHRYQHRFWHHSCRDCTKFGHRKDIPTVGACIRHRSVVFYRVGIVHLLIPAGTFRMVGMVQNPRPLCQDHDAGRRGAIQIRPQYRRPNTCSWYPVFSRCPICLVTPIGRLDGKDQLCGLSHSPAFHPDDTGLDIVWYARSSSRP